MQPHFFTENRPSPSQEIFLQNKPKKRPRSLSFLGNQEYNTCKKVKRCLFESGNSEQNSLRPLKPHPRYDWLKKRLDLCLNEFTMQGKNYRVEKVPGGKGAFHQVFRFDGNQMITIGKKEYSSSNVLLKTPLGSIGPNRIKSLVFDSLKAYKKYLSLKVPVAKAFVNPIDYQEKENPSNGLFWIVEKMDQTIDTRAWKYISDLNQLDPISKKILSWVKGWLEKMAWQKEIIIHDFRPQNVMLDSNTNPKIVDYSLPEEIDDFALDIKSYTKSWAAENPKVLSYLTDSFPSEIREGLQS